MTVSIKKPDFKNLVITTPRLSIRALKKGDGQELFEAKKETWEQLSRVFAWTANGLNADADEVYVQRSFTQFAAKSDFHMVGINRETGKHAIWTGLHYTDADAKEFQIGYWVRESEQGKRFAQESTNALIRFAFNELGANSIIMCHADGNIASGKIISSLGFTHEEMREESVLTAKGLKDGHWYRMNDTSKLPALVANW